MAGAAGRRRDGRRQGIRSLDVARGQPVREKGGYEGSPEKPGGGSEVRGGEKEKPRPAQEEKAIALEPVVEERGQAQEGRGRARADRVEKEGGENDSAGKEHSAIASFGPAWSAAQPHFFEKESSCLRWDRR